MTTVKRRKKAVYRKRKQNRFSMFLVSLVVVMILVVVAFKRIELSAKLDANQAKIEQLNGQIKSEEDRADEIREYEKYTHTKGYVEEVNLLTGKLRVKPEKSDDPSVVFDKEDVKVIKDGRVKIDRDEIKALKQLEDK